MSSLILGIYFLQAGQYAYSILAFSLAGSTSAFLIFNFQPAKIFMGDTGSMLIGMVNSILVIKFIDIAAEPTSTYPITAPVAIGFTILLIPLLDTLRVFGIRAYHRRSPFSPDRNHIHHLLLDNGLSHRNITLTLVGFNALVLLLVYSFRQLGSTLIIVTVVAVFFAIISLLQFGKKRKMRKNKIIQRRTINTKPLVTFSETSILEQKN
jgi:UDP-N-acetylmuramyl pentapeptide phosphotransferase/UDP-N-acetylglucosamine-1-phosphate transferase